MSNNKITEKIFKNILSNLKLLDSEDGKTIYKDSQRIGTGIGPGRNTMKPQLPQKSKDDAIADYLYRDMRLGKESKINSSIEFDEEIMDKKVLEKVVDEIIERDILGNRG